MTDIPQPLLAMFTEPDNYGIHGIVSGGVLDDFYLGLYIQPHDPGPPISTPEPSAMVLLSLASTAYLVRRSRARSV